MNNSAPTESGAAAAPLRPGVYLITPQTWPNIGEELWRSLLPLCSAVQLRTSGALNIEAAGNLRALCRAYSCPLLVNNDPQVGSALDADGIHLGKNDVDIGQARQQMRGQMGANKTVGASCYQSLDRARAVIAAGADYISLGACFASHTKPEAPLIKNHGVLQAACLEFDCPVVAIGGIDQTNFTQILATGVRILAICAGVFAQTNPVEALGNIASHPLFNPDSDH